MGDQGSGIDDTLCAEKVVHTMCIGGERVASGVRQTPDRPQPLWITFLSFFLFKMTISATAEEKLMKINDLLIEIELMSPWTLGLDVTGVTDLQDEINVLLNSGV